MSHRDHQHINLLPKGRQPDAKLTPSVFGALVGMCHYWTLSPHDGTRPDDNHIYLWFTLGAGAYAGQYEVAVNVYSTDRSEGLSPDDRDLRYYIHTDSVQETEWPEEGFQSQGVALSYTGLGLTEANFTPVQMGELRSLVSNHATSCQRISAYGMTYSTGDGLHDVHMNSGNPSGSGYGNQSGQDGALIFYYDAAHGGPMASWLFLKFKTQML